MFQYFRQKLVHLCNFKTLFKYPNCWRGIKCIMNTSQRSSGVTRPGHTRAFVRASTYFALLSVTLCSLQKLTFHVAIQCLELMHFPIQAATRRQQNLRQNVNQGHKWILTHVTAIKELYTVDRVFPTISFLHLCQSWKITKPRVSIMSHIEQSNYQISDRTE